MPLLTAENICYRIGERDILEHLNFVLEPGEHVGLVGRNGTGKSTLLKMIAQIDGLAPDSGRITRGSDVTVGYLHQDPDLDSRLTLRQEAARAFEHLNKMHDKLKQLSHDMANAQQSELSRLMREYEQTEARMQAAGGYSVDHTIDATLHGLGLMDNTFDVNVSDLSGGQQGRLALARLILARPSVLLLDEPTNHLDIQGRQWLEQFLQEYDGTVILVSHDRRLLDNAVQRILELEAGKLVEYPGNYTAYRRLRRERQVAMRRELREREEFIRKQKQFIDRYKAGQRAREAKGREKRLERYMQQELPDIPVDPQAMSMAMPPPARCGDLVFEAEHLSKEYEEKKLFRDFSLTVERGQRIGLIGPNGSGKTTLACCLLNQLKADSGSVRTGANVDIGSFSQTHEDLPMGRTVVEYLQSILREFTEQQARDLAGQFLFSGDDQEKPLGVLSGGERSRAMLAGLVAGGHNVLLLDEPTNHLDIPSSERLEEALKKFSPGKSGVGKKSRNPGTLLLISHDRMLLDSLVDQLIVLDGEGNVSLFNGTWSDYLRAKQEAEQEQRNAQRTKNIEEKKKTRIKQDRTDSDRPFARMTLSNLEKKIEALEDRIVDIDRQMSDPEVFRNAEKMRGLKTERDQLEEEINPLNTEWELRAD